MKIKYMLRLYLWVYAISFAIGVVFAYFNKSIYFALIVSVIVCSLIIIIRKYLKTDYK